MYPDAVGAVLEIGDRVVPVSALGDDAPRIAVRIVALAVEAPAVLTIGLLGDDEASVGQRRHGGVAPIALRGCVDSEFRAILFDRHCGRPPVFVTLHILVAYFYSQLIY